MSSLKIILFLGCMTLAACELLYDCEWTECKNNTLNDYDLCVAMGFSSVGGLNSTEDCLSGQSRRYCCISVPLRRRCSWTAACFTPSVTPQKACLMEFKNGSLIPTRKAACSTTFLQYECCY
ncbi:hypothetical protein Bhyg_09026 [Pseudolycoriella hygida]|uniref:Uncharacterized protein n=1 Tax=Pseudolycoriella hygida TaxID=35572 RepID=A0A9Q0N5T5_9DIPT|nr:hypothetical protein Bhyg_09026 [Pseudolycoriella hygida]